MDETVGWSVTSYPSRGANNRFTAGVARAIRTALDMNSPPSNVAVSTMLPNPAATTNSSSGEDCKGISINPSK
ncbi:MAG: hypothetical protein CL852_01100 [Crocinitomicaceae bacterium]|nr:hypothetical protein [Crocinitomicaceae bacterium]